MEGQLNQTQNDKIYIYTIKFVDGNYYSGETEDVNMISAMVKQKILISLKIIDEIKADYLKLNI